MSKESDVPIKTAAHEGSNSVPNDDAAKQSQEVKKDKSDKKKKRKRDSSLVWTVQIFVITLILTFTISMASETVISEAHIVIAVLLLLAIIATSVLFDLIGTAFASGDILPFLSMSSRKVYGAKMCVYLLKRADRVSNICADVIGDICGIVSGSAGAVIAILMSANLSPIYQFIIATSTSSVIAALTVGGKSMFKSIAIKHSHKIVFFTGKVLSVFGKK